MVSEYPSKNASAVAAPACVVAMAILTSASRDVTAAKAVPIMGTADSTLVLAINME